MPSCPRCKLLKLHFQNGFDPHPLPPVGRNNFPIVMLSKAERIPRSGRARARRNIPRMYPLPC